MKKFDMILLTLFDVGCCMAAIEVEIVYDQIERKTIMKTTKVVKSG